MNCRKRLNKVYHLTSNLLLHYRAKVECSTLATLRHVIQCKCDTESFIYSFVSVLPFAKLAVTESQFRTYV